MEETKTIQSPDGNITVELQMDNSQVFYYVRYKDELILDKSSLGVIMEDADFSSGLKLISASGIISVNESYTMLYGKKELCNYKANKVVYHLENSLNNKMDIVFQVSDDGIAFQYFFPDSTSEIKRIKKEQTSFHFLNGTKAWLQPCAEAKSGWGRCNPSYEEHYFQDIPTGTSAPHDAGWVFPALFKYLDTWVLISETGLEPNYCGTRLEKESFNNEYFIAFPQKEEVCLTGELNPESALPWYSPWRVIAIGSLKTIVESTLGTDLAVPAIDGNFTFVKPGRASWSWVLLKDGMTVFEVQKDFIEYASEMGWEYCLIDAGWDLQIGYDKIKKLADYGKAKNVGIILWYNSAGDWNDTPQTPRDLMLTHESRMNEFAKIKEMGIKGVKVDFFGGDGQSVIKYYHDILTDAAEVGIMVNFHGCTLPRGWQRKYPNLVNMEAIKGMEFLTFGQADADLGPNHNSVLPFTRNVFDPMDYTPVCFSEIPNISRHSTQSHELALAVLFLGGVQHFAEIPEGMANVPDYVKEIMKEIPVKWDDTKFIDGYPGKLAVVARKKGNNWYVAGINGENQKKDIKIDLSPLDKNEGFIIKDGDNNRSFVKEEISLSDNKIITLNLLENGGFLMKLTD